MTYLVNSNQNATLAELEERIDFGVTALADDGFDLIARNGQTLLEGITDHEQTAADLREMAELIELYGQKSAPAEGEAA